ncbi:MAG: hypothetical protein CVU44_11225 [Chloroflexi bacterium HGW-Chloroflexi-6]|nr:MAG: hypothetical protein CVU44_11225 [Chloroflexi bacterium HGW-Chloroflexi-6]
MDAGMGVLQYAHTCEADMLALDADRRQAELECTDGREWADLAQRYEQQGRPAQASRCMDRARHYGYSFSFVVSVETAQVAYA